MAEDARLVEALARADEATFIEVVDRYQPAMFRLALTYTSSRAVAEEVVQEAWLGLLDGIKRFEGRSSLRTWLLRIVTNIARRRAQREGRSIPFSSLDRETESGEPAVEPRRFGTDRDWSAPPQSWAGLPEDRLFSQETMDHVRAAVEALPELQRQVIMLRDIDGLSGDEVCNVLLLSDTNQRVLLHRARSKVRARMEQYLKQ